jgi:hypothetical protein
MSAADRVTGMVIGFGVACALFIALSQSAQGYPGMYQVAGTWFCAPGNSECYWDRGAQNADFGGEGGASGGSNGGGDGGAGDGPDDGGSGDDGGDGDSGGSGGIGQGNASSTGNAHGGGHANSNASSHGGGNSPGGSGGDVP